MKKNWQLSECLRRVTRVEVGRHAPPMTRARCCAKVEEDVRCSRIAAPRRADDTALPWRASFITLLLELEPTNGTPALLHAVAAALKLPPSFLCVFCPSTCPLAVATLADIPLGLLATSCNPPNDADHPHPRRHLISVEPRQDSNDGRRC